MIDSSPSDELESELDSELLELSSEDEDDEDDCVVEGRSFFLAFSFESFWFAFSERDGFCIFPALCCIFFPGTARDGWGD